MADSSFKFQLTKMLSTRNSNLLSHAVITAILIWTHDHVIIRVPKMFFPMEFEINREHILEKASIMQI